MKPLRHASLVEVMRAWEFVHRGSGPFDVVRLEQGGLANDADAIQKFPRARDDVIGKTPPGHPRGRPPISAIEALEVDE